MFARGAWFYQALGGINVDAEDRYRKILIQPNSSDLRSGLAPPWNRTRPGFIIVGSRPRSDSAGSYGPCE